MSQIYLAALSASMAQSLTDSERVEDEPASPTMFMASPNALSKSWVRI
jgi:hypothetical protein